jgi:hypothetical protein
MNEITKINIMAIGTCQAAKVIDKWNIQLN